MNFYETLRFELKNDVGITVATHGWIGAEMRRGKFVMEEGTDMQWKEEREVGSSSHLSHISWIRFYDHSNIRILYYCLIIRMFSRQTCEAVQWSSSQSTLYRERAEEIRTWSIRAGMTYSSSTESLHPKSYTGHSASSWARVGPPGRPPSSAPDGPLGSRPRPKGWEARCSRLPLPGDSLEAPRGPPRYPIGECRSPTEWSVFRSLCLQFHLCFLAECTLLLVISGLNCFVWLNLLTSKRQKFSKKRPYFERP